MQENLNEEVLQAEAETKEAEVAENTENCEETVNPAVITIGNSGE